MEKKMVLTESDVEFFLSLKNIPLERQADGFLGIFGSTGKFTIFAQVKKLDLNIYAIAVDGKKNISFMKDKADENFCFKEGKIFSTNVDIKEYDKHPGLFITLYPMNHLRLLQAGENGRVKMWEASIVSQNGKFFFKRQKVYDTFCFQNSHGLKCHQFEKWPQMMILLSQLYTGRKISSFNIQPDPPVTADGLEANMGRVIWYNYAQGVGAVATKVGPARVHWSQIPKRTPNGFAFLKKGEIVSYLGMRTPHQPFGYRLTGFQRELQGVTL